MEQHVKSATRSVKFLCECLKEPSNPTKMSVTTLEIIKVKNIFKHDLKIKNEICLQRLIRFYLQLANSSTLVMRFH